RAASSAICLKADCRSPLVIECPLSTSDEKSSSIFSRAEMFDSSPSIARDESRTWMVTLNRFSRNRMFSSRGPKRSCRLRSERRTFFIYGLAVPLLRQVDLIGGEFPGGRWRDRLPYVLLAFPSSQDSRSA